MGSAHGGIGARSENGFSLEHSLPIMAGAAMETLVVRLGIDAGGLRLHSKADIYMADPAGELRSVQPMIEYDGAGLSPGVIVKNHLAILGRFRCRFGQIDLRGRDLR
jgi:hypothetical protein